MAGAAVTGGYAKNAFASGATGAPKQMAYANALRSYAPHSGYVPHAGGVAHAGGAPFAPGQTGARAPHLSQAPPLDQYLIQAYGQLATDPQAQQYEQQVPGDINRLWRLTPTAPIFKPGYAHNPYVTQRADTLRSEAQRQSWMSGSGGGVGTYGDEATLQQGASYGLTPIRDEQGFITGWYEQPQNMNNYSGE